MHCEVPTCEYLNFDVVQHDAHHDRFTWTVMKRTMSNHRRRLCKHKDLIFVSVTITIVIELHFVLSLPEV